MLAVEAPVRKLAVIAGMGLAVAAFVHRPHAAEMIVQSHHRLTLHTSSRPEAIYLTVFAEGRIEYQPGDLRSIEITGELQELRFATRTVYHGCKVEGHETLVPIDRHSYSYSYDERILSCSPDADSLIETPRTGIVTVDD